VCWGRRPLLALVGSGASRQSGGGRVSERRPTCVLWWSSERQAGEGLADVPLLHGPIARGAS